MTGIPQDWIWRITPDLLSNLTQNNMSLFTITFNVPSTADAKTYDIDILANSVEAVDVASTVFRVFVSDEELYQYDIDSLREQLVDLRSEGEIMQVEGYNVTTAFTLLDQAENYLDNAQDNLDSGNIDDTIFDIRGARNILENVDRILSEAIVPPGPTGPTILEAPPWFLFLMIALLLVLIVVIYFYLRNRRRSKVLADMYGKPKREYKKEVTEKVGEKPSVSAEQAEIRRVLATLKSQHDEGLLSDEVYQELKKKNEERLGKLGG
jgi:hypothetical protein